MAQDTKQVATKIVISFEGGAAKDATFNFNLDRYTGTWHEHYRDDLSWFDEKPVSKEQMLEMIKDLIG